MHERVTLLLENNEEVELSLSFKRLAYLKKVQNSLYQKYNAIMTNQKKELDILDMPFVLYIAYWCANYKINENIYSEEEFIELIPFDLKMIKRLFTKLTSSKKNRDLEKNS